MFTRPSLLNGEQLPPALGALRTGSRSTRADRFTVNDCPPPEICTPPIVFAPSGRPFRSSAAVNGIDAPPGIVPLIGETAKGPGSPLTVKSTGRSPVFESVIEPDDELVPRSMEPPLTAS